MLASRSFTSGFGAWLLLVTLTHSVVARATGADPETSPDPAWPQTRAERTEHRETSHLSDVTSFLDQLMRCGAPITVETIGHSTEGRPLLLVTQSDPPVSTASEARRLGKLVVYIQANIHGGEVEGKEAILALLRDWAQDANHPVRRDLVLVITPVYNVDGNEAFGDARRLRSSQNGPAHVGRRPNGQGLDLNRDCVKAESPEMRAVLEHVYRRWDPDVVLDLHTTNGTRHGFDLTYSPPLDPNTPPSVMDFTRDELLPAVRAKLRTEHDLLTFDYGNAVTRDERREWRTFGPEPRYVTNYAGARSRIGILSEATSYRPFDERIRSTRLFVEAVLAELIARRSDVLEAIREADRTVVGWGLDPSSAPPLGVRFDFASRGRESVPLEPADARPGEPVTPTTLEEVELEIFDRFRATATSRLPAAYFLPAEFPEAAQLLQRHGIAVERLDEDWSGDLERFGVDAVEVDERPYQGHRLARVSGAWHSETGAVPRGSYVIRTAQPLAILAFHLLEPESADGLAAWGFLDRRLSPRRDFPIRKTMAPVKAATTRIGD